MAIVPEVRYCVLLKKEATHHVQLHEITLPTLRSAVAEGQAAGENGERRAQAALRQLDKPEQKLLLRLVDMEDTLRYQACLDSFVSGFRLANGIQQELAQRRPYSFEEEEAWRICEQTTGEED